MTQESHGDPDDSPHGEAWIVASNSEFKIRVRNLTLFLQRGGTLRDIRLIEGEDARWTMWVRLDGRAGEFRVNQFKSDQPRTYRDVKLAVICCRTEFGYYGPITLVTDKLPGGPNGKQAEAADQNFAAAD